MSYDALHAALYPDGCHLVSGAHTFHLHWSFARPVTSSDGVPREDAVHANAFRDPTAIYRPDDSFTAESYLWTSADGTQFNVYGNDADGFPLSRDVLDFVARSLDPSVVLPGD